MKKYCPVVFLIVLAFFSCTLGGQVQQRKVFIDISCTGEFTATILTDKIGEYTTITDPAIFEYDDYKNTTISVDILIYSGVAEVKIYTNGCIAKKVALSSPNTVNQIRVPFAYYHYGW